MFPETPVAVSEMSPFNLKALLAAEQAKSKMMSAEVRNTHRQTISAGDSDDGSPEIPEGTVEEWERLYFEHLTTMFRDCGCSVVDIHYLLQRYGLYLIKYRSLFGTQPTLDDVRRKLLKKFKMQYSY